MQIAPINNSHTSFKRVIKINNIHTPNDVRDKYLANDNIYAVERILNNNPSSLYNEQEQAQIKEFIKDATRDYKWDVLTRRIPNLGVVLVTGSDVAKIKKMEKRQKVEYNPNVSIQDVKNMRIEKALLARLEDGSDGKPRTVLEIYTASPQESYERVLKQGIKADKIDYVSYIRTFYPENDGSVDTYAEPTYEKNRQNTALCINCDYKTISFNKDD